MNPLLEKRSQAKKNRGDPCVGPFHHGIHFLPNWEQD